MKTLYDRLKDFSDLAENVALTKGIYVVELSDAVGQGEEYATEQTAKWRELYEAMKKSEILQSALNSTKTIDEYYAIIKIDIELRQKIAEIEQELNLNKK